MNRNKLTRQAVHELLRQQQLGVLSTVSEDSPYASLVAFAVSDDNRHLFFVTQRATRKFANISANAQVALLVNNSINNPEYFHKAADVTAVGIATPVPSPELETIRKQYLIKHPYLEEFAHSPSFIMPLAAGIVERRGGMLIHGAIIAREYGLPCVTGVVDATSRIRTGQSITVDGYLGIVTIGDNPGKADSQSLWWLRGFLDRLAGGVGLRRGRRHPKALGVGDGIDFWRVLEVKEKQKLVLLAEMKVPGQATLTFELAPFADGTTQLTLLSRFLPQGIAGILYWYSLYPLH